MKDKEFTIIISPTFRDCVVTTPKKMTSGFSVETKYFSHYDKALAYLKEQFDNFIDKMPKPD